MKRRVPCITSFSEQKYSESSARCILGKRILEKLLRLCTEVSRWQRYSFEGIVFNYQFEWYRGYYRLLIFKRRIFYWEISFDNISGSLAKR